LAIPASRNIGPIACDVGPCGNRHPLLAVIGFEMPAAVAALGQVGFNIAAELLPTLVVAGKQGIKALADWFEKDMSETPEVNGAATYTMVQKTGPVSQALQETHPNDKDEIADALREGLKAHGGSMIRNVEMRMKGRGGKQEIRAEDDSRISRVTQNIESDGLFEICVLKWI
jgi:hypothetical protein